MTDNHNIHSHTHYSRGWMKLVAFTAVVLFVTLNTPHFFPSKPAIDHSERIKELEENVILKTQELETVQKEMALLQNTLITKTVEVAEVQEKEQPTKPSRKHLVTKGDTLTGISLKYYGTSKRWMEIYEANKDLIPDKNNMRVGITLTLP